MQLSQPKARGGLMARMQELPLGAAPAGAKSGDDESATALRGRRASHADASLSPFGASAAQASEEASRAAFPGLAAGARPQGPPKAQHSHLR